VEAVRAEDFLVREKQLLQLSKQWMGKLPFDRASLLIVDEMGKNLSGTGMDTNILGRKEGIFAATESEWPKIRRIYVRSLTPQTHGNAAGVGLADFCHRRVLAEMDEQKTRVNTLTSGRLALGKLPYDYPNDRQALEAALATIGLTQPEHAKIMWIKNTLTLEEVACSAAYWDEAKSRDDLEIIAGPTMLEFDESGELPPHEASGGR
jgi:hypothetical protein